MGFSGSAPEEKKPAAAPAAAAPVAAAPAVAVSVPAAANDDIIAVICAAVAACDNAQALPVIGRVYGGSGWTNYARIATVTTRDQMF
jgi:hypothetical protein